MIIYNYIYMITITGKAFRTVGPTLDSFFEVSILKKTCRA